MHKIERELIQATNFKPRQKYSDRQDYLKSLFLATTKMNNDEFDNLTDPAADWVNECVQRHNSQRNAEFPDFDEKIKPLTEDDLEDEPEAEAEAEGNGEDVKHGPKDPDDEEADEPEDDDEDDDDGEAEEVLRTVTTEKPKPSKRAGNPLKYVPADVTLDKWGCLEGSKNSQALALFERGATSREVKDTLGGTYYNILAKMVKAGHILHKNGSLITLTHKDVPKKSKK